MKKLKTFFACLILLCSCVIFASCQSGVQKVEFGETSPVVMEVGETYSPNISVTPSGVGDVSLSTSDARVVVISPDNKLVAVGVGSAQIEARVGDKSANLVVEVVEKRQKLETPVGFHYEAATNRLVWSPTSNASSYDVEVNGEIVAKNLTTNFYEITSSQNVQKVRIKANGINRYSDSDFTKFYQFKNLESPTNLVFDKSTQALSWSYPTNSAKFKVCINKVLMDVASQKSFVLNLVEARTYDISVVAVAESQSENGVLLFDSLRSESLEIVRLGGVDKDSIVWNASENLLTWGEVENAKYKIVIDNNAPLLAEKNNLRITKLEKGIHEIKITPVSDENLVLDANDIATSNVAITKQLSTPEIVGFDADTNKLTLTNIGEAQTFKILSGGVAIYDGPAEIVGGNALITLPVGCFDQAGEYRLAAISTEDTARFYTESNLSETYIITRLSAPTYLNIENGTTFAFATLPQATFGYTIFVAGAEQELSEPKYELYNLVPGRYEVKVKYLGNKNTILESAYSSMTVEKLSTPVLEFDKSTMWLSINKDSTVMFGYDITINGSLHKNVWPYPGNEHDNQFSLDGLLAVGQNQITVQTLPQNNEILSNVATIDIYKLEEIANIEHETKDDVSYIKFDTNPNYTNYVVKLNSLTNLDYTASSDGGKTILKLKDATSAIFENAGKYTLIVEAHSTDKNIINAPTEQIQIEKLAEPLGLAFEFPNKLYWNRFVELDNNFELLVTKDGATIHSQTTTENELSLSDLALGTLKAKVKLLGNGKDVLDSNYCAEVEFAHEKLSKPQNVEYSDDLIIWSEVVGADYYEISIGSQKFESESNSFVTADLSVGQYHATIKALCRKDATITSDYAELPFTITRKLASPTNLQFDKATRTLTFGGVATATNGAPATASKYMVYINGSPASAEYTNKTSFIFNSDAFLNAGTYAIEVQAYGEGIYTELSAKSDPLTLEKLAAPTAVSINDEIISCAFNSETVDYVEILVNGIEGNNLKNLSGEIAVKARYIGKTNELIDSEYYETTIYRLGKLSSFKLENDIITWSPVANASGYVLSIKPENENLEKFYLGSDVSSFSYEFRYEGSYTIEIYAQGGEVDGKQYLDSARETLVAKKNVAPTNVRIVEDPTTGLVTISCDYDGEENSASKYAIYVNGTLVGDSSTKTYQCSSTVFGAVGQYLVTVKAVGNNANNHVSSTFSSAFVTVRLANPYGYYTFFNGQNYTFYFLSTSSETDYRVVIENEVTTVEGLITKLIKDQTIPKSSDSEHLVSFAAEMQSNEFVEGKIKVTLQAIGNNTTALRSVTSANAYSFAPRPVLSNDADRLLIKRTNESYQVSTSYYVTDADGKKSETINIEEASGFVDEYQIPNTWLPGTYTFIARQYLSGGVLSAPTEYTVKRLANVADYTLSRDETDTDIIYLSWPEVEEAQGYVVYAAQDQNGANAIQIYSGTERKCSLPLTEIQQGQLFFFFKALGGEAVGFSSQTVWVGSNKVKLFADGLNLRNENGVLTWSDMYGVSQLSSGFKLVINGTDVINLDANTFKHDLVGYSGQLNIKLKHVGDFVNAWGVDSDYAELNIVKLPKPINIRVVEGEIKWDHSFTLGEGQNLNFVYNIGNQEFDATPDGIAQLTSVLLANKEYKATVQAKNPELFLSSDPSDEISIKILNNPNTDDNTTYISTNIDKTISSFNWVSTVGASKYEVEVAGETMSSPLLQKTTDTKWKIPSLDAGAYSIRVRRIGGTGLVDGVGYLSSGFSTAIAFNVLATPEVSVSNGELTWLSQDGANNYYIYVGDGHKVCGNVTYWTFVDEYKDFTKETNINLFMQAIGDGVNFLASAKTSEIKVVKPRPPQMLVAKDGALCWNDLGGYTYFEDTENKKIYLDFLQNDTTYESFEIDVNLLRNGWPLDDNYLQKLTTNLPAGNYTLKIKQIGDSKKVITSEYSDQTLDIVVAPTPTNVFINEHKLQWEGVTLDNYSDTNEIVYVVYIFDNVANDWVKLAETNATFLDVENTNGLLKPQHTSLAVSVKGNTTAEGMQNYVTGNMSEKVDIIVLGSTSDIQTVEGNLTWGIVANAVNYRIESQTNNMVVEGGVQASYLQGFDSGVHNIRIRALGNGTSKFGSCIINGVWGESSTFTKLDTPVVSTITSDDNKTEWGSFRWEANNKAAGYNIYVNNNLYNHIEGNIYESDYPGSDVNVYAFQAKGNSVIPSDGNPAYISSNPSNGLACVRMAKITGVRVVDGKLYWLPSTRAATIKYYFVEFYQAGERIVRVPVVVNDKDLVKVNEVSMVEFDVAGFVEKGTYTVLVREVLNSDTYIAGVESDPIEISKLEAPGEVRLDNGILTWNNVEDATGYILRIVSDTNTMEFVEGFSFDADSNSWRWVSELETGVYRVSLRAVSTDENKLRSSWTTKNGELKDEKSDWQVRQIPKIALQNITVNNDGEITWTISGSSSANIPENKAYIIWRKGEETYINTPVLEPKYKADENLLGIAIRTIPLDGNEFDYFASVFSEIKDVEKPEPPKDLTYDETRQIFTWAPAGTSDATYIVFYSIDGGPEQELDVENVNKFEPTKPGNYKVSVKVKKSNTEIGTSLKSEEVEGVFNLFSEGDGTASTPFLVNSTNFENMMYRPKAHFKLNENIVRRNCAPLGANAKSPTQFLGKLDGNNKTITVCFEENQKSIWTGIFAELGDGAQVKNLNIIVDGNFNLDMASSTAIHAGVIAGCVNGSEAIIENCKVSGTTTIIRNRNKETRFGTFVGLLKAGTIKSCTSELNITTQTNDFSKVGGIVGMVGSDSATNAVVDACKNYGTIHGANTIGGIAAYNYGTIKNSTNFGDVQSEAMFYTSGQAEISCASIAGGIVGENFGTKTSGEVVGGIVKNCENTGVITAANTSGSQTPNSYAGGIVGETTHGLIDENRSRGEVDNGTNNPSSTKAAQAIVGNFKSYSEVSTNYKAKGLSQMIPSGINMTIIDLRD